MEGTSREQFRRMPRRELREFQFRKLRKLLDEIGPRNQFYRNKLGEHWHRVEDWEAFRKLPFTTKDELASSTLSLARALNPQTLTVEATETSSILAANLTYPTEKYVRFHRTSGTRGKPIVVLDTAEDWQWWVEGWQYVLDAADLTSSDRVFLAFSFGPFIGFWSAFEACQRRGALMIPGGGMSSLARLEVMRASQATVVCCTPSYALHLAEVAQSQRFSLRDLAVRKIIVAGEPGGSIKEIRQQIESAWGAVVIDHSGATEIGPWGYGDAIGDRLYVNEAEFIAEFERLDRKVNGRDAYELVLTSLGRFGAPVIRYRTGDAVCPSPLTEDSRGFVQLLGGILGRADDMLIIRGVNIFPSSVEAVLRSFPDVLEFRVIVSRRESLDQIRIEVEDRADEPQRIVRELDLRIGLRIDVRCVPVGSLPRFEGKGKRWVDERNSD